MRSCRARWCLLSSVVFWGAATVLAEQPAKLPEHRVVAMYFHRTQRCPTCKRISAYIDEAIQKGFAKELKDRTVSFYLIDYQDRKNAKFAKAYKIEGPALVLADAHREKVTAWMPMPKVWSLVARKAEFLKYVQDGVRGYLKDKR
jgi:thiol-disulfide isomerase/thioredoxin